MPLGEKKGSTTIIFNFLHRSLLSRAFNQSTKFGAMLDMLTDRCATMCLLATLGTFYPSWLFFFQLSMTIDISCHWIHLHTTLLQVCVHCAYLYVTVSSHICSDVDIVRITFNNILLIWFRARTATSSWMRPAIPSCEFITLPDLYYLACVLEMRYFMLRCICCILPMDPSTYSISQQSSVSPLQ